MNNRTMSFWSNNTALATSQLKDKLLNMGFELDINEGHLYYTPHFKPLVLNYDLIFVRHGETYGNCGQCTSLGKKDIDAIKNNIKNTNHRIYQGNVDTEINQLTELGKQQAIAVAKKLKENFIDKSWEPDIILVSPLTRAKETAYPFIKEHEFENRYRVDERIKEMSFGTWENKRICDFDMQDNCHLFYLQQNALVKSTASYGENFCEVILRTAETLMQLNKNHSNEKILMFSHSMFGAACCFLLGLGQKVDNDNYLAFDGKRSDGTSYTMPHAEPVVLTKNSSLETRLIA